jgi:FtsZ-interacting cell division protein YlmF
MERANTALTKMRPKQTRRAVDFEDGEGSAVIMITGAKIARSRGIHL